MHPEIRQIGPGNCPICGMALEPVIVTGEEGDSPELRDMTRRFRIGLVLTLPVFVLEMGGHLVDLHHLIAPQASNWIQLVFATPVVLALSRKKPSTSTDRVPTATSEPFAPALRENEETIDSAAW